MTTAPRNICLDCRRPEAACPCNSLSPIETRARFVILMHPMEARKVKNGTGRIAHLQLKNSEIITAIDFTHNKRVNELLESSSYNCFILYPGKLSSKVTKCPSLFNKKDKTDVFFIIDATWPCAKKMLKLSHNLQKVQKISFDHIYKSQFLIKQQPTPECLSTIESIHTLILNLMKCGVEENTKIEMEKFLTPFHEIIQFQIKCSLDPNLASYRPYKNYKIKKKTNYKQKTMTNIFYIGYNS